MTDDVEISRPFQDLFAQVYHRILEDERVTQTGLLAYVAVARYANFSDHTCTAKRKTLAAVARLSLRALDGGLKNLEACGYLQITRVQKVDKSWGPSHYVLLDTLGAQIATGGVVQEVHDPLMQEVHEGSAGGARPLVQVVQEGSAGPAHQERETTKEIQVNESDQLPLVASDVKSTKGKRQVKTALDETWDPMADPTLIDWAKTNGAPSRDFVQHHTNAFLDWARATGTKYLDWRAAWRKWLGKEIAEHTRREASQQVRANRQQPTAKFYGQGMFQ